MAPPSPSPTAVSGQRSEDEENGMDDATTITVFTVIVIALLCLVMVAICVYVGCTRAMKKHAESPTTYAVKEPPTGQLAHYQNESKI